jgi:chromosomal replication initiation ATPase DnaA
MATAGLSSTEIGAIFRKDHSSVLHGIEKASADESLRNQADEILALANEGQRQEIAA